MDRGVPSARSCKQCRHHVSSVSSYDCMYAWLGCVYAGGTTPFTATHLELLILCVFAVLSSCILLLLHVRLAWLCVRRGHYALDKYTKGSSFCLRCSELMYLPMTCPLGLAVCTPGVLRPPWLHIWIFVLCSLC